MKAKQKKQPKDSTKHSNEDFLFYNTQQDENEFRNSLLIDTKNNQQQYQNDQFSLYNQSFN